MLPIFKTQRRFKGATIAIALVLPLAFALGATTPSNAQTPAAAAAKAAAPAAAPKVTPPPPARAVSLVTPKIEMWPDQMEAAGNIMPWQETRVGTEIGGLRLLSVLVNAGDVVKKGQVLARLNPVTVETELDAANAQLMEAQAALAQADATLERGKRLAPSGGVSQQELTLYETQKQTAAARVNAARAQVKTQQLRLDSATLVAPDDGVISSRSAVEGAIVQAGSELFRLIRQGRLEWRAEVKGEVLLKLRVGQKVTVNSPLGPDVEGHVRQVSPTIDLTTRNGLVYVDLPLDTNLKAGLKVTGTLALSKRKALVLPATAVLHEAGAARVFKVNAESRVEAIDVKVGRVQDDYEEITAGIDAHTQVIAKDVDQLKLGEHVKALAAQDAPKLTLAPDEAKKSGD
ncbi:MAG: efflux transporter, family, subunit [Proteobacteria bacterium]|nr:efflux transporter, family, subunit [Pseudomonadota bacterium]